MTLQYTQPNQLLPTQTITGRVEYFTEGARISLLPNMEELDSALLRVTGMGSVRNNVSTMKELRLQKTMREAKDVDGNPVGSDTTYHDVLFTPESGDGHRLVMVDSDFIHTVALRNSYTPVPHIGTVAIPDEIELTVATALVLTLRVLTAYFGK
ncbi:hypothetical protein JCM19239_5300 [Vibrio variabilis]|uniref:Uncharacterized protein n=1 Tax=Vibrio variabilis TaxID=990271 RepID=A0ABQ0JNQ6_9VIBR|nr:hypothetical protein JCM19239_5300 [Vibrio variabilis]